MSTLLRYSILRLAVTAALIGIGCVDRCRAGQPGGAAGSSRRGSVRGVGHRGRGDRRHRLRSSAADRRPLDGPCNDVRRHAHRGHQSGGRRRGGRPAARDPDRRQERRHGQPDRLGRPTSGVSTTSSSIRGVTHASAARCSSCFPARTSASAMNDEGVDPVRQRVEQRGDAARRRDRRRACRAKTQGDQHAAAAGRQREPAGDAAGAVRRSEPRALSRSSASTCSPTRPTATGRVDDAAVRRRRTSTTRRRAGSSSATS